MVMMVLAMKKAMMQQYFGDDDDRHHGDYDDDDWGIGGIFAYSDDLGGDDETDGNNCDSDSDTAFDSSEVGLHPDITATKKRTMPVTRAWCR